MSFVLKNLFTTIIFYPLFIFPYLIYLLASKLSSCAQYMFTILYIQKICGYKRNEKITQAISSLQKLPQNVIIAFSLNKFQFYPQNSNQQKLLQNKIVQDYINILSRINHLQHITIYIESDCAQIGEFADCLKERVEELGLSQDKVISVVDNAQKQAECTQYLSLSPNNGAPLLITFSSYESTCRIPPKYLINAEIAFNKSLMSSTKYDLYRSFCQYSHSKQRNGK